MGRGRRKVNASIHIISGIGHAVPAESALKHPHPNVLGNEGLDLLPGGLSGSAGLDDTTIFPTGIRHLSLSNGVHNKIWKERSMCPDFVRLNWAKDYCPSTAEQI